MAGDPYDDLLAAQRAALGESFAPATVDDVATITFVEIDDSTGKVRRARASIAGEGDFPVSVGNLEPSENDRVLIRRTVGSEAAPNYSLVEILESSVIAGANLNKTILPAPEFDAPDSTSALIRGPGIVAANLTVRFLLLEQKYPQSSTLVYYALDGSNDWSVERAAYPATEIKLSRTFAPGASAKVYLQAESHGYMYPGLESEIRTFALAADDTSPGTATALAVDSSVPGQLKVAPTGTLAADVFAKWRYEFAANPGGPVTSTVIAEGPDYKFVAPAGIYYIRVTPVSRSGVLGVPYPNPPANLAGPYTILVPVLSDTTPPGVIGAPTLAVSTVEYAGTWHGFLQVTRPAYTPPADIQQYEIGVVVDDGRTFVITEPYDAAVTSWKYELGFGNFTVAMRARDTSGNAPAFGATAAINNPAPALSGAAIVVTTQPVGAGIKLAWNRIAEASGYEIERANDAGGSGAATIGTVQALYFIDPLPSDTSINPTYHYRVRAYTTVNGVVTYGAYSARVSGTAGDIDGQNLRADSVVAAVVAADNGIFNKVVAGAVQSGMFSTDASPNSRVEIRGNAVSDANRIKFIENIAGTQYERARASGDGFRVLGNLAEQDIVLGRNASGRGQLVAHGITIGHDGANPFLGVSLYNGAYLSMTGPQSSGRFLQGAYGAYDSVVFRSDLGSIVQPIFAFHQNGGGGSGNEKLAIWHDGIAAANAGTPAPGIEWRANIGAGVATHWVSSGRVRATGFDNMAVSHYGSYPIAIRQNAALGSTGGNVQPIAAFQQNTSNDLSLRILGYRGQTIGTSDWQDARIIAWTDVDNGNFNGGALQLGARAYASFWALGTGGTSHIFLNEASNRIETTRNMHVGGALSKTSGSFVIAHPDPKLAETHELRHCFTESPTRGENIYTYRVSVANGAATALDSEGKPVEGVTVDTKNPRKVSIPLPDYWRHLNENPRVMTSQHGEGDGFAQHRGWVDRQGTMLTISVSEDGEYLALAIGTRKDAAARAWWDRRGAIKTVAQKWEGEETGNSRQLRAARVEAREAMRDSPSRRRVVPVGMLGDRILQERRYHAESGFAR